jgi:hypothetical protein
LMLSCRAPIVRRAERSMIQPVYVAGNWQGVF